MERPALFKTMLESLIGNALGGWAIYVSIEPTPAAVDIVDISRSILANQRYEIVVNDAVLGIQANPHRALTRAFAAGSELNLYLEEDFVISPDTTALASWYAENHKPSWLCLNLLAGPCGSRAYLSDPRFPEQLFLARTFNSIGFATRREEWNRLIEPAWFGGSTPPVAGGPSANWQMRGTGGWGWDWAVYGLLAGSRELFSVQPVLARATHTGRTGTWARPQFHDKAFQDLEICQRTTGQFELVESSKLAREARSLVHAHEELTMLRLQLEERAKVAGGALAKLVERRSISNLIKRATAKMRRILKTPGKGYEG
jgi:hypothetical protein